MRLTTTSSPSPSPSSSSSFSCSSFSSSSFFFGKTDFHTYCSLLWISLMAFKDFFFFWYFFPPTIHTKWCFSVVQAQRRELERNLKVPYLCCEGVSVCVEGREDSHVAETDTCSEGASVIARCFWERERPIWVSLPAFSSVTYPLLKPSSKQYSAS